MMQAGDELALGTPNNCKGRQEEARFRGGGGGSVIARTAKVHTGSPAGVTTAAGVTLEPLNKTRYVQGSALTLGLTCLVVAKR